MLRLRTTDGIQAEEYHKLFRMSFAPLQTKLEQYAAQGWAVCEQGRWHFTLEGFLRSNPLIGGILEAQEADMVKNSAVNLRGTPPAGG